MSDRVPSSRAGSQFGPYRLRRLIGRGGMGELYEAEDTIKGRVVALKLLSEAVSQDPVFRKRLQREAHSASRLREPHVVPIHDYGEIDGLLYVESRLIDGTDLRTLLTRYGPMPPARAVAIVRQVAAALDAAHESGVMHRDVKPENIIITGSDFAYLADFGVANAAADELRTELSTAPAAFAYMAPERFTNHEVTYRVDVYALTCVLHECLTGSRPYGGDSVGTIITAHLMQPIPRPSELRSGIPKAFDEVIARGMAKNPQDRYASAGDLARAANDALTDVASVPPHIGHPLDATTTTPMRGATPGERALPFHDDVQFTVYRPRVVRPYQWTPLLAFAHLGEPPIGSDPRDDPIRQVEQRARAILGDRMETYSPMTQDSSVGLPEDAEITFVLDLPGFDVKAPRRTFLWFNAVHMEEFPIRAVVDQQGGTVRGRLLVYHGSILLAEVRLAMRVDAQAPQHVPLNEAPTSAAPFRRIFPSYSHIDAPIVVQFERYVEALGDRYLRDVRALRAGEVWSSRLCDFIREADVFQLFWSRNAMASRFVEQEWRYALSLNRSEFVRPTYWEEPMPSAPGLPPVELGRIHFHPLGKAIAVPESVAAPPPIGVSPPRSARPPRAAPPPPRAAPPPPRAAPPPPRAAPPPPWAAPPVQSAPPPASSPSMDTTPGWYPAPMPAPKTSGLPPYVWVLVVAAVLVVLVILIVLVAR